MGVKIKSSKFIQNLIVGCQHTANFIFSGGAEKKFGKAGDRAQLKRKSGSRQKLRLYLPTAPKLEWTSSRRPLVGISGTSWTSTSRLSLPIIQCKPILLLLLLLLLTVVLYAFGSEQNSQLQSQIWTQKLSFSSCLFQPCNKTKTCIIEQCLPACVFHAY